MRALAEDELAELKGEVIENYADLVFATYSDALAEGEDGCGRRWRRW